jgi:hypothetical protein
MDRDRVICSEEDSPVIEELTALLNEQPWMECRELRLVEEEGRLSLQGDWIIPFLEGVEQLAYLVSDVALLVREMEDPALAGTRLHAELLPSPPDEATFPFRIWTDALPPDGFESLIALLVEALQTVEEDGEEHSGNGFIQLDEL